MNWYILGAIITVGILAAVIGEMLGSERGYSAAMRDCQEQLTNAMWTQYFNQFQGGQYEISEREEE